MTLHDIATADNRVQNAYLMRACLYTRHCRGLLMRSWISRRRSCTGLGLVTRHTCHLVSTSYTRCECLHQSACTKYSLTTVRRPYACTASVMDCHHLEVLMYYPHTAMASATALFHYPVGGMWRSTCLLLLTEQLTTVSSFAVEFCAAVTPAFCWGWDAAVYKGEHLCVVLRLYCRAVLQAAVL